MTLQLVAITRSTDNEVSGVKGKVDLLKEYNETYRLLSSLALSSNFLIVVMEHPL